MSPAPGSRPSRPAPSLWVDPESGGYRYTLATDKVVDAPAGFSSTVVQQWLVASGLAPDTAGLPADAADLFNLVTAYANGQATFTTSRYRLSGSSSSWLNSSPQGWFVAIVVSFWLLVYLGGIVLYRRVRLRQAIAEAIAKA